MPAGFVPAQEPAEGGENEEVQPQDAQQPAAQDNVVAPTEDDANIASEMESPELRLARSAHSTRRILEVDLWLWR